MEVRPIGLTEPRYEGTSVLAGAQAAMEVRPIGLTEHGRYHQLLAQLMAAMEVRPIGLTEGAVTTLVLWDIEPQWRSGLSA